MMTADLFVVSKEAEGERLDKLLCNHYPTYSRSYFQYLIDRNAILVNGAPAKKRVKPQAGDEIEICFLLTEQLSANPEPIPLEILYEDQWLIAINKPSGLVVHPAPGSPSGTFVNALLHHCQAILNQPFDSLRPGIVHRLDKETTGVLIAAKTYETHQQLISQFSKRTLDKRYLAICVGKPPEGLLSAPIKRHPIYRQEMTVAADGKEALSQIHVRAHKKELSLVDVTLLTGRTHQIRVHLKHVGCPILGDPLYGACSSNQKYGVTRQLLHATRLTLQHPHTGKTLVIEAAPPADMQKFIAEIEESSLK